MLEIRSTRQVPRITCALHQTPVLPACTRVAGCVEMATGIAQQRRYFRSYRWPRYFSRCGLCFINSRVTFRGELRIFCVTLALACRENPSRLLAAMCTFVIAMIIIYKSEDGRAKRTIKQTQEEIMHARVRTRAGAVIFKIEYYAGNDRLIFSGSCSIAFMTHSSYQPR